MRTPKRIVNTALALTRAIGSPLSIVIHTVLFIGAFMLAYEDYITFDRMLLLLTTIVSLEAIYLSLFIQMTINYTTESLEEVSEDIEEMQEDIGEIQEDVDELQEDVEDIAEEDEENKKAEKAEQVRLADIKRDLQKLVTDVEKLSNSR